MSRSAVNEATPRARTSPASPTPVHLRRLRRTGIVALGIVVLLAAAGILADTVAAARAEQRLSAALATAPGIAHRPEVILGGFPYLPHAADGRFGSVAIAARAVGVPGCAYGGGCIAELGATLGPFTVADGYAIGPTDTLHTASVTAYTRLDSVNLGRFLGIVDLTVATPAAADRVGGGGPQFGNLERTRDVVLTGTVALPPASLPMPHARPTPATSPAAADYPGPATRVSVTVDLSVRDGRLRLDATGFYTGPERHVTSAELADAPGGLRRAVLNRFSATLPRLPLPWDLPATGAHSSGSDVLLTASAGPRDLRPDRF
ncbi:MAG: DUF2993 domain-containing protein [Gordonia sp. (in: high G+C Gram-positive bacteria)]